ncbi:BTAD domain-containing putative transcriptional regulator [Kribbella sp. NPDC004536]|uniref:AfsR/SARP family transcriptional regulator n=1 Tax=Kribbella sp. NPDC004536 TaxID=3364106 RepID=UPI0036C47B38
MTATLSASSVDRAAGDLEARPVQIRLLGSIDVVGDGVAKPISGVRRKLALAALALRIGQPVSSDFLIDIVWSGHTPATVVNTLQSHLSYLRRILGVPGCILTNSPGYRLDVRTIDTDLQAAERLVTGANACVDLRRRADKLQTALDLWRGEPLNDTRGHAWIDDQCERIDRLRYTAARSLVDARLALGDHFGVVTLTQELVEHHPFDEDLCAQLITALYRAGRQADALAAYQDLRRRLDDELGIQPGRRLRELQEAVLRQDERLDGRATEVRISTESAAAVTQLPPMATSLIGRERELEQLEALADDGRKSAPATATPVIAVVGTPGVGKSALALSWAHRAAAQFPDGRLYVDLRGFDAVQEPVAAVDALRCLISGLGISDRQLPADANALSGLYRTALVGRQVLIVLDNARDAEQVRPLLPSAPGCLVLVTSRTDLRSLAIKNAAQLLYLGALTSAASARLLGSRRSEWQRADDRQAILSLVSACGGLPLALAVLANRQLVHSGERMPELADATLADCGMLDILDGGDPSTNIRSVFAASCRLLSDGAAQLFAELGRLSGPIVAVRAVATQLALPETAVRNGLAELSRASLLEQQAHDRYLISPLLGSYARELAQYTTSARTVHPVAV